MSKRLLSVVGWFALVMPLQAQQPEELPAGAMRRWQQDALVNHAVLSPDARLLAVAAGTKLTVWDARTGKAIWHEKLCAPVGPRFLAFTPDSKTLAACGDFSVLRFFDATTGKDIVTAKPFEGRNDWWTLAFSPDGKHLATASIQGSLGFWDIKTGKQLRQASFPATSVIMNLDFSPDNNKLAVSSRGNAKIQLWDAEASKEISTVTTDGNPLEKAAFSSDGKSLAYLTINVDGSLRMWDLNAGRETAKIGGSRDGRTIESFAFSPDGRTIAVLQPNDRLVYLLETATGLERARLVGHTERAYAVTFARHGRALLSCGADKTVYLWDVTGGWREGKQQAEKLTPAELTSLWASLGDDRADRAYRAIWKLARAPKESVPFLRDRFFPDGARVPADLGKRIAELDDEDFVLREKAMADLKRLGSVVEKALRRALAGPLSPEGKARIRALLPESSKQSAGPSGLHWLRTLEALELTASPSAREVMEEIARGHSETWITEEARAAVTRWRP